MSTLQKSHFTRTFTGKRRRLNSRPTLCASLRSRNACQHCRRDILYGNSQVKGRRPERAPWSSTGLYTYRKNCGQIPWNPKKIFIRSTKSPQEISRKFPIPRSQLWPPPRRRTGRWSDEFPWHRRLTIFDQPNMVIWWWFRWFDGDFMVLLDSYWNFIGLLLDCL